MPQIIMLLSLAVQAYFYYHGLKNTCCGDRWILYILWVPVVGPLLYFIMFYLPRELSVTDKAKLQNAVVNTIDPQRNYKAAKLAHDRTPTLQNKQHLARVLLAMDQTDEALVLLRAAMQLPMANEDYSLQLDYADATRQSGQWNTARETLESARALATTPRQQAEVDAIAAQVEEQAGNYSRAAQIYSRIVDALPGQEMRCRLASVQFKMGETDAARTNLLAALEQIRLAPPLYRKQQHEWSQVAQQMLKQMA